MKAIAVSFGPVKWLRHRQNRALRMIDEHGNDHVGQAFIAFRGQDIRHGSWRASVVDNRANVGPQTGG